MTVTCKKRFQAKRVWKGNRKNLNSNNDKFRVKNKISKKNGERPNTENT